MAPPSPLGALLGPCCLTGQGGPTATPVTDGRVSGSRPSQAAPARPLRPSASVCPHWAWQPLAHLPACSSLPNARPAGCGGRGAGTGSKGVRARPRQDLRAGAWEEAEPGRLPCQAQRGPRAFPHAPPAAMPFPCPSRGWRCGLTEAPHRGAPPWCPAPTLSGCLPGSPCLGPVPPRQLPLPSPAHPTSPKALPSGHDAGLWPRLCPEPRHTLSADLAAPNPWPEVAG